MVVQWLRVRLPMQGTRVRSLVWEDPLCATTTEPVLYSPRATTTEPAYLEPVLRNKKSHCDEKPVHLSLIHISEPTRPY